MKKTGLVLVVSAAAAAMAVAPVANAATVLTLEGGLVGMQHILHFTPSQLRGDLCKAPNHCQPVDYFAFPGGAFTDRGAAKVVQAIAELPADEQIVLVGHSQGGQVVYSTLRSFAADPANAPDPSRLTWVSIGNPENRFGGPRQPAGPTQPWLPPDTPYHGIEVIRQYDGWADQPADTSNFLAMANALIGKLFVHVDYRDVDLNDPNNIRYTPDLPDGSPGNVTYMWVPTDILPLVAWAGPLAPMLDNMLRPIVEAAYDRPVAIPDPAPPASAGETASVLSASATSAQPKFSASSPEPTAPSTGAASKRLASKPSATRHESASDSAPMAGRTAAARQDSPTAGRGHHRTPRSIGST